MENIILTNNKDLRLVSVKVGVLSTLRFELPLVSASATHVEVIVTSGNVHSAYTATFIDATKRWQCDIAASQFPAVGRQSYEVAYVLDGKQFWDGKGWIEIEDATTSGIVPQPQPGPHRYAVVSVNGYYADNAGAVRIPKTFIITDSPATTEGYIEGDICFNRETGATWTLCDVQGTLTWVFNYKNYYTKAETEEAIDRVAAYYITYDAAGNPFPTYSALANATTVYSGGAVRIPTRNDYCVVVADETHQGAEYRYIYAVAEGQTTGSWQPQFPVEGVLAIDQTVTKNSANPVTSGGIWSAIWGALSALPTGFTSLYDWCVDQLAGKVPTSRTVNGKALSSDVTIGDTDIPYAGYGSEYYPTVGESLSVCNQVVATLPSPPDILYTDGSGNVAKNYQAVGDLMINGHPVALAAADPAAGNLAALDANGNPTDSGVKPSDKLDSTSAAPAFSSDSSVSYPVGSYVTYNGKLYKCTTATTGGTWVAGSWTEDTMTDPDAVLDITSQNQLRVVAKNGTLLWAQGYDLASTSSATLACDAANNFTFANGATTQAFTLPTAPTGKVGDFGLDIDNSANASAATITLTGLDTTFSVVVPEGESLNDMLAIAAGELARFYITLSTFRVNNLPTWHIVKQVVENGGATV